MATAFEVERGKRTLRWQPFWGRSALTPRQSAQESPVEWPRSALPAPRRPLQSGHLENCLERLLGFLGAAGRKIETGERAIRQGVSGIERPRQTLLGSGPV
jgi:hypothetical protein